MVILDFGSGNTCKNSLSYVKRMIDELKAVDTGKHEVIIKWQLFEHAPPNIPLDRLAFRHAFWYAQQQGYKTTASVFDLRSLNWLLHWDIPFVKIANRPDLYWLAGEVPRKIPVYLSMGERYDYCFEKNFEILHCVSKYPATVEQYEEEFLGGKARYLNLSISDHTTDFTLYRRYKPKIYECHYKLEDSTGPDAGDFARTPKQLGGIL